MTSQITLRHTHADDRAFMFTVFTATRAERFNGAALAPPQLQHLLEMQFNAQQSQYRAQFPGANFSLVLSDDKPIGYFYVDRSGKRFTLIDIALLPELTGKGVGSQLVTALIKEALEKGKTISAHVDKCNNQAWQLWQRLGFQIVGDDGVYFEIEYRPDENL